VLTLESKLTLNEETILSPNLCDRFTEEDLRKIGAWVKEGYARDKSSRASWERRTEAAMDLAMQTQKAKSFPWPNCSNVAFPLITISVLQYHAKAYPALIKGTDVVRYRVVGEDVTGEAGKRAQRVGSLMSWQVLEEDRDWQEQQDRLLINYAVVGTAFKKSYYSNSKGYNESELVFAKDLVLDYYAKSVDECPRKTHVIPMFRNEIYERVRRGAFRDILEESWYTHPQTPAPTEQTSRANTRTGQQPPAEVDETTPLITLEQHVNADFDKDGYAEPYIITVEESSGWPLRIVTRFDNENAIERNDENQIVCIKPVEYFTKYGFLPSPDGSILDIGFGVLMGPLNESVNSAVNQIFDAGTMQTTGGGFLGRGAKIRGGVVTIAPNQWVRVDSDGSDLQKSIVPNPVREPSNVLYQLLVLLINYSNRISGALDVTVGENMGQNTPAETARTMNAQGMKIYNAIFKRTWHSMKEEFRKLYLLNAEHLPERKSFGNKSFALREDFFGNPDEIAPVADPNITSEEIEVQKLMFVKQQAMGTQGYNLQEVELRLLRALNIDGVSQLYPGPGKVPALPNPKVQVETLKLQAKQGEQKQAHLEFILKMQEEHRLNTAKIIQLIAQAEKLRKEGVGVEAGHQIAAFDAALGALKQHNEHLRELIKLSLDAQEKGNGSTESDGGRVPGMATASGDQSPEVGTDPMATGGAGPTGGGVLH